MMIVTIISIRDMIKAIIMVSIIWKHMLAATSGSMKIKKVACLVPE